MPVGEGETCPRCQSHRVLPIAYGFPGPEMFALAERGEIVLGGCIIGEHNPNRACLDCGEHWYEVDDRDDPG